MASYISQQSATESLSLDSEPAAIGSGQSASSPRLRVKVCTFNINGEDLTGSVDSICRFSKDCNNERCHQDCSCPHIIVFCFQESMKLSMKRIAKDLFSGRQREERCEHLRETLREFIPARYVECHAEQMVGLFTIIFSISELQKSMLYAQSAIIARGFIGLGNKGAIGIRLKFNLQDKTRNPNDDAEAQESRPITFVFVNAHLAASEEEVARRNEDFGIIGGSLHFPATSRNGRSFNLREKSVRQGLVAGLVTDKVLADDEDDNALEESTSNREFAEDARITIYDTDYLFVAGDLNYRIALEHDDVTRLIKDKDFVRLLQSDQLNMERAHKRVLQGFEEAEIKFRPTYKFDKTTDPNRSYDTSEKHRTPSYTDRILYHTLKGVPEAEVLEYTSHEDILCSDHLPVSLTVQIPC